ncbi:MAG: adenylate/guanylate cyclase domain-containing protein [Actinomycetota bacterium]
MAEVGTGRLTEPTTFVFTDVAGSTKLWAADPEGTARSFVVHDAVVRAAIDAHGGELFGWAGDSFRAAFGDRQAALAMCEAIHEGLSDADWGEGPGLRVRIGVTHGQALARDGEYFGPVLNTAARLQEIAHPEQTVVGSAAVAGLEGVSIAALGRHRVRDVADEIELFQLSERRFPPLRTVDAALSTLPPLSGSLVGRRDAILEVRSALSERRPVTVVGTGGAGKTRLAIEVAHLELSDHADGCYFVDLAPVTTEEGVAPAIARSSRIKLSTDDALQEIVDYFATRQALLVLDNCEHLIGSVRRFVQHLSISSPGLSLMSTSREALGVSSERVIHLGPLSTSDEGGPAVELFVHRIRDNVPDFEPTPAELVQIAEICGHLDGIPLALELAAARSGVLGLDHLLDGMHDRFRVLSSSQTDGSRTLREAIDWSFGLLTDLEQDFFARCGVFNGSFDLRAASAVAPEIDALDIADVLHSLTRKSLISSEGALGGRFRLLETIRAYALLQLGDRQLVDDVRDLHFAHYRELVAVDEIEAAHDLDRAARLTPEWSNISGALEWGVASEHWHDTARLAAGCIGLWEMPVPAVEGKRWIELLLAQPEISDQSASILRYALSALEAQLDNFDRVFELMTELCEGATPEVRAIALGLFGYLRSRRSPETSEGMFAEAQAAIDEYGLGTEARVTLTWARGAHAIYKPDLEEASSWFRQGFEIAQASPVRTPNTVYAGLALVTAQLLAARPADALATLDSYNWSDSRWDSSAVLRAVALIDLDRAGEAADLLFQYANESLLGRMRRMSNDAMIGFAALALHRGETGHAWHLMKQAITPRTPFTIGLVEGLADRIGRGDELREAHRTRQVSLAELDAIDYLRAEMNRLTDATAAIAESSPSGDRD